MAGDDHETTLPDAGEPAGTRDADRPAMLGKRFRLTVAMGMAAGLVIALAGHAVLVNAWYDDNAWWGWLLAGIGGVAIGGACSLFIYGTATDRHDVEVTTGGRADVVEEGEVERTLTRRRRRSRGYRAG